MNEFMKFSVPTVKFKRLRDYLIPLSVQEKLIRQTEGLASFQFSSNMFKNQSTEYMNSVWVAPYPFITSVDHLSDVDLKMYSSLSEDMITRNDILYNRINRYGINHITNDMIDQIDQDDNKVCLVHIWSGEIIVLDSTKWDLDKTELFIVPVYIYNIIQELKNMNIIRKMSDQEIIEKVYAKYTIDEISEDMVTNGKYWNYFARLDNIANFIMEDQYILGIRMHGYNGEIESKLLSTFPEVVCSKDQFAVIMRHILERLKSKDKVILVV